MNMDSYVVGWDGGGTKTAMQARSLDGTVLLNSESLGLNYNSYSEDELKKTVHTLISMMDNLPGGLKACRMLCISTAGLSNPKAVEFFNNNIRNEGLTCDIRIFGDYEGALYGALGKPEGVVLVSGTGSVCFGRNESGHSYRAGGWGHIIDDEGSGYAIGRDILSAAVKSYDKRIPKSILYDLVLEKLQGNSVEDIIQYIYKPSTGKKEIAAFAPLLIKAAERKDRQAVEIEEKAALALTNLAIPVIKELDMENSEIAFTGGILTNFESIYMKVKNRLLKIYPQLKIIKAKYDSVSGITLMALELLKRRGDNHGGYVG